jgi:hypothetical protein
MKWNNAVSGTIAGYSGCAYVNFGHVLFTSAAAEDVVHGSAPCTK